MRIGIFGGTFDPVHRGHVEPVLRVKQELPLDRVLFVPTARPPHKDGPRSATALQRFTMVELALLDEPDLRVEALEMNDDPSYTVDTLERLRSERPEDEHVLLVGADSFVQLPAWRRWRRILELVELAVMVRPGWTTDGAGLEPEMRRAVEAGRVHLVENEPIQLSSRGIRRELARGRAVADDALHPRVLSFIEKYGLYRQPA